MSYRERRPVFYKHETVFGSATPHSERRRPARLQADLLQGVSRTFALTIPQLPPGLEPVVGNAYLLCRIVDTIEDEPMLSAEQKAHFAQRFVDSVDGTYSPEQFATALTPLLSGHTIPAERHLIQVSAEVIRTTHRFAPAQRQAIQRCIRVMASGMVDFQRRPRGNRGLDDLEALSRYCYHVAGVVGEMLTELFCHYSHRIASHREALMPLAVAFGQGLQMTNIIKDLWDDHRRGACWLPRDVFLAAGFDLDQMGPNCERGSFNRGLEQLVAIAHDRLDDALRFVLLIPREETGIRLFCLWAIGMALLTLRKIHRHPNFTSGAEVKISRRSVRATYLALRITARNDLALRSLAQWVGAPLPRADGPSC